MTSPLRTANQGHVTANSHALSSLFHPRLTWSKNYYGQNHILRIIQKPLVQQNFFKIVKIIK